MQVALKLRPNMSASKHTPEIFFLRFCVFLSHVYILLWLMSSFIYSNRNKGLTLRKEWVEVWMMCS